jgi:hypothetical protein
VIHPAQAFRYFETGSETGAIGRHPQIRHPPALCEGLLDAGRVTVVVGRTVLNEPHHDAVVGLAIPLDPQQPLATGLETEHQRAESQYLPEGMDLSNGHRNRLHAVAR